MHGRRRTNRLTGRKSVRKWRENANVNKGEEEVQDIQEVEKEESIEGERKKLWRKG
jgi:hypothetical protein